MIDLFEIKKALVYDKNIIHHPIHSWNDIPGQWSYLPCLFTKNTHNRREYNPQYDFSTTLLDYLFKLASNIKNIMVQ